MDKLNQRHESVSSHGSAESRLEGVIDGISVSSVFSCKILEVLQGYGRRVFYPPPGWGLRLEWSRTKAQRHQGIEGFLGLEEE